MICDPDPYTEEIERLRALIARAADALEHTRLGHGRESLL
jgi:hypothetical protein